MPTADRAVGVFDSGPPSPARDREAAADFASLAAGTIIGEFAIDACTTQYPRRDAQT